MKVLRVTYQMIMKERCLENVTYEERSRLVWTVGDRFSNDLINVFKQVSLRKGYFNNCLTSSQRMKQKKMHLL